MNDLLPTTAYIALGANLGDRAANLRTAMAMLHRTPGVRVTKVSAFLENPAVGGPADSPDFLNAVAEVQTRLSPIELLHRLLEIERALGRERVEKWGPRTIDLDLLIHGNEAMKTSELTLPHPRLHERRFVLSPLAEIAGLNDSRAGRNRGSFARGTARIVSFHSLIRAENTETRRHRADILNFSPSLCLGALRANGFGEGSCSSCPTI